EVSVTRVPEDRPPFPLPNNVFTPALFTIQPGLAYVYGSDGVSLVYPNYSNAPQPPASRFNFWHYDPDGSGWSIFGQGTGTPDSRQVIPDPGVRIYEFTGAMINGPDSPGPQTKCKGVGGCTGGDPVDLSTGTFIMEKTDLFLPDVIPLKLTRTYVSSDTNQRAFGIGITHPYRMFLWSAQQYQQADLILPNQARIHYVRTTSGTGFADAVFEHRGPNTSCPSCVGSPTSFYGSVIRWNGGGWDLTLKDGTVYVLGENAPLQAIRDRSGNQITITRDGGGIGNITQITSPNG